MVKKSSKFNDILINVHTKNKEKLFRNSTEYLIYILDSKFLEENFSWRRNKKMVKLGHHETLKLYNCLNIRDVSFTV